MKRSYKTSPKFFRSAAELRKWLGANATKPTELVVKMKDYMNQLSSNQTKIPDKDPVCGMDVQPTSIWKHELDKKTL